MTEIPKRPARGEFGYYVDHQERLAAHEHAVAKRAYETLRSVYGLVGIDDPLAMDRLATAIRDIDASGWQR